ncbi:hypothetical protein EVAR_99503_1 [Eumeta japonica]|uniref:Uncharacterized protein n=1 Tax=Eumeta variegata TaxID=151549 RepID=A0A4C1Z5A9_EUMVA|nr:hypothetical protein EVAR_99503_1 [Eumeta japonica]
MFANLVNRAPRGRAARRYAEIASSSRQQKRSKLLSRARNWQKIVEIQVKKIPAAERVFLIRTRYRSGFRVGNEDWEGGRGEEGVV